MLQDHQTFCQPTHRFGTILCALIALSAMLFIHPALVRTALAAPVYKTGYSWQTVLDRNNRVLTYSFDHAGGISLEDEGVSQPTTSLDTVFAGIPDWEAVLKSGLDAWGASSNITFKEVADNGVASGKPGARGQIRFKAGPIVGGVAYAYLPMATGLTEETVGASYYGDVFFSSEVEWDKDYLLRVVLHELGHSLGLMHNEDPYAIMSGGWGMDRVRTVPSHDLIDIRALYFPVNSAAPVFEGTTVTGLRDWFALLGGTEGSPRTLTIAGHIRTEGEQKTAVKGIGESLSAANYAFDRVDLTINPKGRITTRGDNAYGIAAGDFNTVTVHGVIETFGVSSDGISILGNGNTVTTANDSRITTHGSGANAVFLGGAYGDSANTCVVNGTVVTTGNGGAGVFIGGYEGAAVRLTGDIITRGEQGAGIYTDATQQTFISLAPGSSIATSGFAAHAVWVYGSNNTLEASGSLITTGVSARGIISYGSSNTVVHNGSIETHGENSQGIYFTGGNGNTLIHGGRIETNGIDSVGVRLKGSGNLADVSGAVLAAASDAVRLGDGADTDNRLLIHGSPAISGDLVNTGADGGAALYLGAAYDLDTGDMLPAPETVFIYDGDITGATWTGRAVAGTTVLRGGTSRFSLMTIDAGATLGGATVFSGNLVNNGTLSPGNTIGTIGVAGDYTQSGNLVMEFGAGGSDVLDVSGTVTFEDKAGLTVVPVSPVASRQFSLVSAGAGITGALSLATRDTLLLDYTLGATEAAITLDVDRLSSYAAFAAGNNQSSLAAALDNRIEVATGDLAQAMTAIDRMTSRKEIETAYSGLTPDEYAAVTEINLAGTRNFSQYIHQVLTRGRTEHPPGWRAHGRFLYRSGDRKRSGEFSGFDWDSQGVGLGLDYRFPHAIFGFGASAITTGGEHDAGVFDLDTASLLTGGYVSFFRPGWHVDLQAGYGRHETDTRRAIAMTGFQRTLRATETADQLFASLEAGIGRTVSGNIRLSPFTGLDVIYNRRNPFDEGGSTLSVHADREENRSARFTLGTRLSLARPLGRKAAIQSGLKLAWAHEFGDTRYDLTGSLDGRPLQINGYEMEKDRLMAALDLTLTVGDRVDLNLDAAGEWDGDAASHTFQAAFAWRF